MSADTAQSNRHTRYQMRRTLSRVVGKGERVGRCGCKVVAGSVSVGKRQGRAYLSGVETCGSVWACPVCAPKIAEKRRLEVRQAITRHLSAGGAVYMTAFTVPHQFFDSCKELRSRVSKSFSKVISGKRWKKIKADYHLSGYIRALEVTHGKNGWHPHIHTLFFVDKVLNDCDLNRLESVLFDRWSKIVERDGGGWCNRDIFRLEACTTPEIAGDYVGKWGVDSEITRFHLKKAKGGGFSPWDFLQMAHSSGTRAARLFREFLGAFKGARQLTWSLGLKRRFKIDEMSDREISSHDAADETLAIISKEDYYSLLKQGLVSNLLDCAENGGTTAIYAFLAKIGRLEKTADCLERRYRSNPKIPESAFFLQESIKCQKIQSSGKDVAPIAG